MTTVDVEAFERFEVDGWEARAQAYVDGFAALTGELAGPLLDAARVDGPGARVLDLGCGPGQVAAAAAARGAYAEGVDAAAAMVALAQRAHPELTFAQADALELPYGEAEFDAVLANVVLLHLGRPEAAVREAVRVLVPGGTFAATIYDAPARARTVGVFLEAVGAVGPVPPVGVPPGPDMFALAAEGALDALLEQAGLIDRHVERVDRDQEFPSVDVLWHALTEGTVRAAALMAAQPAEKVAAMRAALEDNVAEHRRADGTLVIRTAYLMAYGTKER